MIRELHSEDRDAIVELVRATGNFNDDEVGIARELVEACINDPLQKDYFTFTYEDDEEKSVAVLLFVGWTSVTTCTYERYWIASHPYFY